MADASCGGCGAWSTSCPASSRRLGCLLIVSAMAAASIRRCSASPARAADGGQAALRRTPPSVCRAAARGERSARARHGRPTARGWPGRRPRPSSSRTCPRTRRPRRYRRAAAASGIRSEWAAPIVGTHGVLGTVSGFAAVGRPEPAQLELARLPGLRGGGHRAGSSCCPRCRGATASSSRCLEMLETLAGPTGWRAAWALSLLELAERSGGRGRC